MGVISRFMATDTVGMPTEHRTGEQRGCYYQAAAEHHVSSSKAVAQMPDIRIDIGDFTSNVRGSRGSSSRIME